MVKNRRVLEKFENQIKRQEKLTLRGKFLLLEAMYKEAIAIGSFSSKNSLLDLDVDLRVARIINSVS